MLNTLLKETAEELLKLLEKRQECISNDDMEGDLDTLMEISYCADALAHLVLDSEE